MIHWYPAVIRSSAIIGKALQAIETTDPIEARRARFAQYRGGKARFTLMGSTITGIVRSVMEVRSSAPKRWIITVIAMQSIAA
jgi:hypothetical protein